MSVEIICDEVRDGLDKIKNKSVQTVVTSPPYWGLRDYGVDGQIGLENSMENYVSKLVRVFQGIREVLKEKGTVWLNIGDSYCSGSVFGGEGENAKVGYTKAQVQGRGPIPEGLKRKDLVGIPWRVALALQEDGWYLRNDIIWQKPNPMPESVKDRCTTSHEHIFLLTKSKDYYYDHEAIKEDALSSDPTHKHYRKNGKSDSRKNKRTKNGGKPGFGDGGMKKFKKKNKRDVWEIATKPFNDAHFAVFPPELPETCIKAGSKEGDTVLDPFCGAGTTGLVADRLKRDFIGIDLNPEYCEMARERIYNDAPMMQYVEDGG